MRSILTLCAAACAAAPAVSQQEEGSAYSVSLEPIAGYVRADQEARLRMVIEVEEDTELSQTLLAGVHLETKVGGVDAVTVESRLRGDVTVAGGTRIERTLRVPVADVGGQIDTAGMTRLTFTWPGIDGATATVQVTPDTSRLSVDDLDLKEVEVLLVTNHGTMSVGFRPEKAPNHVRNFVKLALDGFYDGTRFHRVIPGFMIQGGCPNTKEGAAGRPGTGNAGYTLDAEFNDIRHTRGVLSMARSQDPNSASCQFFVLHGDAPHLDGQYTAFGHLERGADTLDSIARVPLARSPTGEVSAPREPVHLYLAAVIPGTADNKDK